MLKFSCVTPASRLEDNPPNKNASWSQVAIYNEDDLSHLLYVGSVDHGSNFMIINKAELGDSGTRPESALANDGMHGPSSDDESAALSECDEDGGELEVPSSPSRRRGGTMSMFDHDFEFPIFLGRQQEVKKDQRENEMPSAFRRPALRRCGFALEPGHEGRSHMVGNEREGRSGASPRHVESINGPLMSWWPATIEKLEYDWEQESESLAGIAQQVSATNSPLMLWWPGSPDMVQYDWNERFFE